MLESTILNKFFNMCVSMHIYICIYACIHVCIYIYTYIHTDTHIQISVYKYIHTVCPNKSERTSSLKNFYLEEEIKILFHICNNVLIFKDLKAELSKILLLVYINPVIMLANCGIAVAMRKAYLPVSQTLLSSLLMTVQSV